MKPKDDIEFLRPYSLRSPPRWLDKLLGNWAVEFEDTVLVVSDRTTCQTIVGIANGAYNLGRMREQLDNKSLVSKLYRLSTIARQTLVEQRREFARSDIEDLDALEDVLNELESSR